MADVNIKEYMCIGGNSVSYNKTRALRKNQAIFVLHTGGTTIVADKDKYQGEHDQAFGSMDDAVVWLNKVQDDGWLVAEELVEKGLLVAVDSSAPGTENKEPKKAKTPKKIDTSHVKVFTEPLDSDEIAF